MNIPDLLKKIAVRATVGAGDTLWGIVTAAMKQTGDRRPVDEVIYYTRKTNKLTPADVAVLVIGTELVIPCEVRK